MAEETAEPAKRGRPRNRVVEVPTSVLESFNGTKEEQLQNLYNKWYGCTRCELCNFRPQGTHSLDITFGDGNPNADMLIIGEAPGEEEEATSVPFVGSSGKLLNQILAMTADDPEIKGAFEEYSKSPRVGVRGEKYSEEFHSAIFKWRQDNFFITNAIACRPPDNRPPNKEEIEKCWERLMNIVYIVDPLIIVTCGSTALSAMLQKAKVSLSEVRGKVYDISYNGKIGTLRYPILPTFHPSYLLRKADYKQSGGDFQKTVNDWRKAFKVLDFLRNQYYGTPIPERG